MNAHKILGIFCLAHYVVRFAWLIVYGDMFFRPESWFTWILPAVHVLLSSSSFIFPVPLHRFGAKPIIWRELQLHNIVFTSRSAAIFYLQLARPCYSDTSRECVPEHFVTRLLVVMLFHYVADRITDRYQDRGRTTTRDIPWDQGTPEWLTRRVKTYYAVCQVIAVCALVCQQGSRTGQGVLEGSFAIMLPIQMSTFLMTLVRKGILTGTQWHLWYAVSLGLIYLIPITESIRSLTTPAAVSPTGMGPRSTAAFVAKLLIAPASCVLRLAFGVDKNAVMALSSGCTILLASGPQVLGL